MNYSSKIGHQPPRVAIRHRDRRWGGLGLTVVATLLSLCLLAAVLSLIASASSTDANLSITPLILIACAVLSITSLTIVSLSQRMLLSCQIFFIYFLIYLIIPGYSHALVNIYPLYGIRYSSDVSTRGALCVLLFLVSASIGMAFRSLSDNKPDQISKETIFLPDDRRLLFLIVISYISTVYYASFLGADALFQKRSAFYNMTIDNVDSGLSIVVPRIMTFIPVIYSIFRWKRFGYKLSYFGPVLISVPAFITVNWPLSLPRAAIFGYILFIAVIFIDFSKIRNRAALSLLFFFGATVAMPIADGLARVERRLEDFDASASVNFYLSAGDFDGLQAVHNGVLFVDNHNMQHGRQILSAALFFVPRAIWPSKAQPTGSMTAEAAGYDFLNISQPLPSEFYVDFGFWGVVIGGLLVGWVLVATDRFIGRGWNRDGRALLVACFMVSQTLLIYRGTLLGVVGPAVTLAGLMVLVFWGEFRVRKRRWTQNTMFVKRTYILSCTNG